MTGPANIPSLAITATKIVSGEWQNPYGRHSFYTAAEWAREAQSYLENGCDEDACDFAYMIEQEEEAEREQNQRFGGDYADYLYDMKRDREMVEAWERGL